MDKRIGFEKQVVYATGQLLEAMEKWAGVDRMSPNFRDTPQRVARAYVEILDGLFDDGKELKEIFSKTFPSKSTEMVVVGPVHVWSVCAHHLLPVEMHVWLGYLPRKKVLGLSKLARLATLLAKKPGLQEDVTIEVAEALQKGLSPVGCGCYIRGRHLCMAMRGIKSDAVTTSSQLLGDFLEPHVRSEFLAMIHADVSKGSSL